MKFISSKKVKSFQGNIDFIFRENPVKEDCDIIFDLISRTGFFSDEELRTAIELMEEKIELGSGSTYQFVFAEKDGKIAGYSCYGLIPLTASSFDLYWIAVDPAAQGYGIGRIILSETEVRIKKTGGERIYAETSSRKQYMPTRKFYMSCGYKKAAVFDDFYSPGDGKIVFMKKL